MSEKSNLDITHSTDFKLCTLAETVNIIKKIPFKFILRFKIQNHYICDPHKLRGTGMQLASLIHLPGVNCPFDSLLAL